jgi:hypothetical protein
MHLRTPTTSAPTPRRRGRRRRAVGLVAGVVLGTALTAPGVASAAPERFVDADRSTGETLFVTNLALVVTPESRTARPVPRASADPPVVGVSLTPSSRGYWLVAADGGVFASGDAGFHGSLGGRPLNAPIVGMEATPSGQGYWLVASDGGVFAFGDAGFHGSLGGRPLNAVVNGIARTDDARGYWLSAADGGVFSFGEAGFRGSLGGRSLNAPVVDIANDPADGHGYYLAGADGGVFSFGNARFSGSDAARPQAQPAVAIAVAASGRYTVLRDDASFAVFP